MTKAVTGKVPERFARHALVEGWNQERLAEALVVLIGVGALGNEVARQLAMAGVGSLVLCDPDVVRESNLSRCCLFRGNDVGTSKVRAAARELAALAPGPRIEDREAPLDAGVGLAELREADLVIGCLDSNAGRVQLARRCALAGAGHLDAGTSDWGGEVHSFFPGGACFGCLIGAPGRALADDPVSCSGPARTEPVGASAPVSALIGSWLVAIAVRRLFDLPTPLHSLHIDASTATTSLILTNRAADCPLHETLPADRIQPVPVTNRAQVGELLHLLAPDEDVMTWRGFESAAVRRMSAGAAGAGSYNRSATLLRQAERNATLGDLGIAPREILCVLRPSAPDEFRYIELSA